MNGSGESLRVSSLLEVNKIGLCEVGSAGALKARDRMALGERPTTCPCPCSVKRRARHRSIADAREVLNKNPGHLSFSRCAAGLALLLPGRVAFVSLRSDSIDLQVLGGAGLAPDGNQESFRLK